MKFTISILRGDDVHDCCRDKNFTHAWKSLARRTPHVTVFQEPEFVNTWYREYASRYEPVLVQAHTNNNRLVGLIPLAIETDSGDIDFAGAQHVEYSGWLSDPRCERDFIIHALATIKNEIPFTRWQWAHLSPHADASWLHSRELENAGVYSLSETANCPILDLHKEEKLNKILKNKSVKSKINRLKRQGELRLERIENQERVAELIDKISDLVNFRHESAHHDAAFEEEPIQKDFYMARGDLPSANHYTAMWMGDTLLAFNFGVKNNDTVYIGLTAFDPTQSKHSPGVIFLIYLASLLKEEKIQYIDFTPGGDEYKERFCNTYNRLQRPTFYSSKLHKTIVALKANVISSLIKPLRLFVSNWQDATNELVKLPDTESDYDAKFNIYRLASENYSNDDVRASERVNVQVFQDLLNYKSNHNKISRQRVLSDSTKRFSREETLFTIRNGDELLAHAWATKINSKYSNHQINFKPDKKGVVLDCLDQKLNLPNSPILKCLLNSMLDYTFAVGAKSATIFVPRKYAGKSQEETIKKLNFIKIN